LSISLAHQARFAPLQTSLCIAVCGYLIWRKEHRTIGEIRGWLKSLGAKPTGQRTNQSPTKPALNIGHLFQAEKDLMHRIHNFTGGRIHRVAIWGAGQNGQALARLLHRSKDIEVVCFIDDGRVGSREQNIAIRSPAAGLQDADAIFIAMNASSETIQRLAEVCDQHCKPWLHVANNCL
jgi:hypothetical protein